MILGFHSHLNTERGWDWGAWHRRYGKVCELARGRGLALHYAIPNSDDDEPRPHIHVDLWLLQAFLFLPWKQTFPWSIDLADGCMADKKWGFDLPFDGDTPYLFLYYGGPDWGRGEGTKLIEMPWSWGTNVRHDILTEPETHPYTYTLKSGEVQERNATIYAEEREWRRCWLPWRRVCRSIDVRFDGEVGERTGSWKGGTIGCGYTMEPGETPLQTLRRMERERVFR